MPVNPAPPKASPVAKKTVAQRTADAKTQALSRQQSRAQSVNSIFKVTALALTARGLWADAGAIARHGPLISAELSSLAETDARIASLVDYLETAGPYTGLFVAVMPLVFQLAVNHDRMDADKMTIPGVVHKEVLEKEIKKEIEEAREEAMKLLEEGAA